MNSEVQRNDAKYQKLETRIRRLETYWFVTISLAAILGLGGAFLGNTLKSARKQVNTLQEELEKILPKIEASKKKALETIGDEVRAALTQSKEVTLQEWLNEERANREKSETSIRQDLDDTTKGLEDLSNRSITTVEIFAAKRELRNGDIDSLVRTESGNPVAITGPNEKVYCALGWTTYRMKGPAYGVLRAGNFWQYHHYTHDGENRGVQATCVKFGTR